MKIKTKKEMNLPELIEWGWKNKELSKNKRFTSKNKGNLTIKQSVIFNDFSYAEIECNYCYGPEDIFTVEIEEPITEETKLDLIERFISGPGSACYKSHGNKTIKECSRRSPEKYTTTQFYIENDYRELVLIWTREKGLVE